MQDHKLSFCYNFFDYVDMFAEILGPLNRSCKSDAAKRKRICQLVSETIKQLDSKPKKGEMVKTLCEVRSWCMIVFTILIP